MANILGYSHITNVLFHCITFLVEALPLRSAPTFIELVVGVMLTQAGFVTQAYLALPMKRNWSSYYKWIEHGKWSWASFGIQMAKLLVRFFPQSVWHLIIDDTLILRSSKKKHRGARFIVNTAESLTDPGLSGANAGSALLRSSRTGFRLPPSQFCPGLCETTGREANLLPRKHCSA